MALQIAASPHKEAIVCIPGLGGHKSAFEGYAELFPGHSFYYLEVRNWREALDELRKIVAKEGQVTLFCHCYGTQLGLRLIDEAPEAVSRIILLEPFFSQFHHWRYPARLVNTLLVIVLTIMHWVGFRRNKFPYRHRINYKKLAHYPVVIQPLFDMRWQSLKDYFGKTNDLLWFNLPSRVDAPTLFVLSSNGYFKNKRHRKSVFKIFKNAQLAEVQAESHNMISIAPAKVASVIGTWFAAGVL